MRRRGRTRQIDPQLVRVLVNLLECASALLAARVLPPTCAVSADGDELHLPHVTDRGIGIPRPTCRGCSRALTAAPRRR